MNKYKICPICGKRNLPKMLECVDCETDLSNVRIVDEEIEQNVANTKNETSEPINIVRVCDCGAHNPPNARKCMACGEDISDIIPKPEEKEEKVQYVLSSLDGLYAYKISEEKVTVGREQTMSDYLSQKPYVSRKHADFIIRDDKLFIQNLSQTNYTYVNNEKISEGLFELSDGDEIGMGGNQKNGVRQEEAAYFQVRIGTCI